MTGQPPASKPQPSVPASAAAPILRVEDLHVEFRTDDGVVKAVNGVSFAVAPGETLGIVGESGSGKSVTSLAIMGLIPNPPGKITSGRVFYGDQELTGLSQQEFGKIRGRRIAMIFQDPMTALNPFLTVEEQLSEVTMLHLGHTRKQAIAHAIDMLDLVGIAAPEKRVYDYPHKFSGGMRQRVMIAMALCCEPDILIADEPTTALDVTIQAQILDLMRTLQQKTRTAILFITHDLGVVANVCHRVQVMYGGRIVEQADADPLFANPRHPYTLGLLHSAPRWDASQTNRLTAIEGQPPNMAHPPSGCTFHPRCPYRIDRCEKEVPPLFDRPDQGRFACFVDVDKAEAKATPTDAS
ncbi:ABC transporter ATP-binding protein [Lignipirellula cremea]|uniref:Oligopeptide transport ATP-binding protein OppD n=1 Tax=Lignipirellula cremea TaxID=2528010 RepID=A0A518DYH8_9BACT|nr:ABC transporter ATP-binding protein [Lignipirellula cremea]QDU96896.1 Oligopeptide transport ATP-binding protein OppD [Lignipirellula cremea]